MIPSFPSGIARRGIRVKPLLFLSPADLMTKSMARPNNMGDQISPYLRPYDDKPAGEREPLDLTEQVVFW